MEIKAILYLFTLIILHQNNGKYSSFGILCYVFHILKSTHYGNSDQDTFN